MRGPAPPDAAEVADEGGPRPVVPLSQAFEPAAVVEGVVVGEPEAEEELPFPDNYP